MRTNKKSGNGAARRNSRGMISLTIKVPLRHLKTFEFYGKRYQISLQKLLQSEIYGQATSIIDDPFWYLDYLEKIHSDEDLQEVTLEFCQDVYDLLLRISSLLRRPAPELFQGLVSVGACTLADMITDALEKDQMENHEMFWWVEEALKFERLSKLNQGIKKGNLDHWRFMSLSRPSHDKRRISNHKQEVAS